ncbi:MAG: 2-amino-4-hydroxy-6-hydroxymethyldihydropteridine diphosphokinase [Curvibacter sp.]|nr:2-amino-4-hydroxy-6-hydroxymethyldihydropteridine diphosphokinase [Curvibacter sp.]
MSELAAGQAPAGPILALVGVGGNLGDARTTVESALQALSGAVVATRLLKASSLYRTAPQQSSGPDYVNAVALVETLLSPLALLQALQSLEQAAGRERPYRNAPRTLDLDLLAYGDLRLDTPTLILPHPRMHQRAFVLQPLAEICPERVSSAELAAVADQAVERFG